MQPRFLRRHSIEKNAGEEKRKKATHSDMKGGSDDGFCRNNKRCRRLWEKVTLLERCDLFPSHKNCLQG